jgi:predicted short-subunit dehydrogenase-like oxidoreductase (DUF2520 family)
MRAQTKDRKVVLIGSGNVSTVLGRMIIAAGHTVVQVVSRNREHAQALADTLSATATEYLSVIDQGADLYIISVSDNALPEVVNNLRLEKQQLVVHTTGSASIDILSGCSPRYGVLYPLQSLRKERSVLPLVPLLTDGVNGEVRETLAEFAASLSRVTGEANDEQRIKLHIGAVLVSNFTNFLYSQADSFCKKEGISFSHLLPIIEETALRLREAAPADLQTGPAIRKDTSTIEKHLALLEAYPELALLYRQLSDAIMK